MASSDDVIGEIFPGLVTDWERTCGACPAQFEGRLRDGRAFYFRYRHGIARLGFGPDVAAAVDDPDAMVVKHGDELDGSLTDAEFQHLFVSLALLRLVGEG